MKDQAAERWARVVSEGDAEDKAWHFSSRNGTVLRDGDVIETLPPGTDSEAVYARMEFLRKRAVAQRIVLIAMREGLIANCRKIDERIMHMAKIEDPETLFAEPTKPTKPSITDITRSFG